MQSPHAEWALLAGSVVLHVGVLDYLRARGEADGDTLSECLAVWFRTDLPAGRATFAVVAFGATAGLVRHICKPRPHLLKESRCVL